MPADLSKPFAESCCDGGANQPHGSAKNCGCDEGAGHICEWHLSGQFARVLRDGIVQFVDRPMPTEYDQSAKQQVTGGISQACGPIDRFIPNDSSGRIRTFDTGATRDTDDFKPDFEGFLSPLVMHRFGEYMVKHRVQTDGTIRPSDNWQKGIPRSVYIKSAFRHFFEWWTAHRNGGGGAVAELLEDSICALLFNAMGYLFEVLNERNVQENAKNSR